MPPKGYQSAGETITPVGTRIPQSWFPIIEAHMQTLRRQNPALRVSQSDALRDLIRLGMQSLGKQLSLFEDAPIVQEAPPGASAMEQAAAAVSTPPVESQKHAAPGMRWCKNGLHQYPMRAKECPECRCASRRVYKQRQKEGSGQSD
jgi:hypothetical protein